MTRKELLNSKEYWLGKNRLELFRQVDDYLKIKKMSKSQFAKKVGISERYLSTLLNGDFNGNIENLVKICLCIGKVPTIEFKSLKKLIDKDKNPVRKRKK